MGSTRKRRLPQLEVRSRVDGAWYDGDISIEGSQLRVHFNGFGREDDEIWDEEFLRSTAKFREIVRLRSKQLQDSECKTAMSGMVICANYRTRDGSESKYYDAKILVVHPSEHDLKRGKELCKCQFKVVWESGPDKGQAVILGCAEISFISIEDVEKHPVAKKLLRDTPDNSNSMELLRKSNGMGTRKRKNKDPDSTPHVDIAQQRKTGVLTRTQTNPHHPNFRAYPKRGNEFFEERVVHTSGRYERWASPT